jgi:hypothetical protein
VALIRDKPTLMVGYLACSSAWGAAATVLAEGGG